MIDWVRRELRDLAERRGPTLEVVFGCVLWLMSAVSPGLRLIPRLWLTIAFHALRSLPSLLREDGTATIAGLGLVLARLALALVPALILFRRSPGYRRGWLAWAVCMVMMVSSPMSLSACATIGRWLILAGVSAAAAALSRVRFLAWTIALPILVLWETAPGHALAGGRSHDPGYRERMLAECARHDGERPADLTADRIMPYHGINTVGDDLVLLTGEGANDGAMRGPNDGRYAGSWWLRRQEGRLRFERPSDATGNLWRGCSLDGTTWMARANHIIGAKRLPAGGPSHEEVRMIALPSDDVDFGETACDPERHHVYVTEATTGGMWEATPGDTDPKRYRLGGAVLLPKRRFDGMFVVRNTASIMVFSPGEGRVVERVPAAIVSFGFDVCDADGAVAMADLSGRLRLFTLDAAGHYRFAWGVPLFAPRRVAFSRDCSRIAVTSSDDHSVYLIDAATRRVVDVYQAGPALREVAPTGPREMSITDVCSITTYRW